MVDTTISDSSAPRHGAASSGGANAEKAFDLIRWFSVLSLVSIALVAVISSVLLTRFLTARMLAQDADVMTGFVQSITSVQGVRGYFLGEHLADRNVEEFVAHLASLPDVLRINVYSKQRIVLWSSDSSLIGKPSGPNDELDDSLGGTLRIAHGIVGEEHRPKKLEHMLLSDSETRFVETYMPVRDPESRSDVIGVVEVYRIPNSLFDAIREGNRLVLVATIIGGIFLYLTLYGIVHRANRLIESQQRRLVESETMGALGEMASAVAHGIRNPLASIRTSAELCLDSPDPTVRESAGDVTAEVDRVEKWVRDLLAYSLPANQGVEAVDVGAVIAGSVDDFGRELEKRGVAVRVELDPSLPAVRGDSALLGQVVNSLIANALDAMPGGGELMLQSRLAEPGVVRTEVSDTGVGIPPDRLDKVFVPFFTTKQKGLGVGLPMVRRIVERFGGRVAIGSRVGHGTTVSIDLPVAR